MSRLAERSFTKGLGKMTPDQALQCLAMFVIVSYRQPLYGHAIDCMSEGSTGFFLRQDSANR